MPLLKTTTGLTSFSTAGLTSEAWTVIDGGGFTIGVDGDFGGEAFTLECAHENKDSSFQPVYFRDPLTGVAAAWAFAATDLPSPGSNFFAHAFQGHGLFWRIVGDGNGPPDCRFSVAGSGVHFPNRRKPGVA